MGFKSFQAETYMMVYDDGVYFVMLLIYVYDILVKSSNEDFMQYIIIKLNNMFALKNLGELSYFLGIKITIFGGCFHLN